MSNRRNFVKISLITAAGLTSSHLLASPGKGNELPDNIIYSEQKPGRWPKKAGSHLPEVTVEGRTVTIKTDHGMSGLHYIVRHTLVAENGDVLSEKTFFPTDEEAISVFEVSDSYSKLYATSFCNKHDLWIKEFSI
ncbi:MAG: hypothetical protein B6D61_01700 [Bacteroidetes bacterium 4484_249]|nr:MAG: hypothetical protein B6D61_01700 [Bacteroidetes bacterium 4484_249]